MALDGEIMDHLQEIEVDMRGYQEVGFEYRKVIDDVAKLGNGNFMGSHGLHDFLLHRMIKMPGFSLVKAGRT